MYANLLYIYILFIIFGSNEIIIIAFFYNISCFLGFAIVSGLTGCNRLKIQIILQLICKIQNLLPDQISHNLTINLFDSSFNKASIFADRGRIFQAKIILLLDQQCKSYFLFYHR